MDVTNKDLTNGQLTNGELKNRASNGAVVDANVYAKLKWIETRGRNQQGVSHRGFHQRTGNEPTVNDNATKNS